MKRLSPRPPSHWKKWAAALPVAVAGVLAVPAQAQDSALAVKTLTEQARFWESKGRSDLAAAAWKRLLQIDPRNSDALAGMAQYEIDSNRPEAAREIAEQLKRQPQANKEAIRRIEGAVTQKSLDTKLLDQARAASRAGRVDESVGMYRQLLDGRQLSGPIALEYYQTLGGSNSGWEEARRGLERLSSEDTSNHVVALAYAQHLTYRAATRREGIRLLADLSRKPSIGPAATDAWRKGLIWLEAGRADTPLFQAFLNAQPNDAAIRARVASLNQASAPRPIDPRSLALRDAYNALNMGDIGDAEKRFETLLSTSPKSPDGLGGLGVVRLKQERFPEAEKLLMEATRLGGNRKWQEALRTARFWHSLDLGDQAAATGDLNQARRFYERAQELDSKAERPPAALADLLVQEGRLNDAENAYKVLRQAHPKSVDVLRGYAGVLVRLGKVEEALVLAETLSDADKDLLGYGSLRAEQYRLRAVADSARGDAVAAMQSLEEALLWDANSPWLRLELARLYHRSGAASEAFGLMDGLLQSKPDMPDALHAAALMSAEAKEYTLALNMLEKIPPSARTREMSELQRQMWVRAQVAKAEVLARAGQNQQALTALDQALQAAGRDGDLLGAVAQSMVGLGDESRSITMMRTLLAQTPKPSVDLLVQYAGLLLKTRQDVELAAQLRQLYAQPLTPSQRKDVDDIRWAYSVRQTDAQREAGNFSAAYEIAAQLLSERPNDIPAQQALARLYNSAGEPARALAWYHQVLQLMDEPDVPTLVATGGAALAAGELSYAKSALDVAARIAPTHPDVLTTQGRLARAQGQSKKAVELMQQAQQVSYAQSQMAKVGPLGVNMVDYTMPAQPVRAGVSAVATTPLIPNPLGGRAMVNQTAPAVRPVMQAPALQQGVPSSQLPAAPRTPSVYSQQISEISPEIQRGAPDQMVGAGLALQGGSLRPVQYQPAATSVFAEPTYRAPAGQPWQQPQNAALPSTIYPAPYSGSGPMLTPVAQTPVTAVSDALGSARNTPAPYQQPLLMPPTFTTAQVTQAAPATVVQDVPRVAPVGSWDNPAPLTPARRPTGPGSLQREIDELRADRADAISAGGMWRGRSGESGTSQLTDFSTVVEGRFPFAQGSHFVLRLEPVFISAGRVNMSDQNSAQLFGANALALVGGGVGTTREQQDSGVAFSVAYETAHLKLDLGTTPLGFQVGNFLGGVAYNDSLGDVKLKLDLTRRAVTDSVLSYAGTRDDVTGRTWGGVTATGGRVELGVEQGAFGIFGYGGLYALQGRNVVNNSRFEVGGGAYYKMVQDADMEFTTGVSVTALGYKRNLRYFTLGHGGYFSPQSYFSLALPLELTGRSGRMAYKLDGSIGIQTFRENSAAYFPGDATLQSNWETVATANSVAAPTGVTYKAFYPSQSKSGLGFRLGGEAEYQFAPQWTVGGKVAMDNASSYTQTSGIVYLKYSLDPIYTPLRIPPKTLKVGQ